MNSFVRNASPNCLTNIIAGEQIFIRKGISWKNNYLLNGNANRFGWGTFQLQPRARLIVNQLSLISLNHCFYCDAKWVQYGHIAPEIDHFCPKTVRPFKAYYYPNLFLSCGSCNGYKGNKFSRSLLKFDSPNYSFDDYFFIDFESGKIRVRTDISIENRYSARYTLTVLGINKDARPETRLEELANFENAANKELQRYNFRYFLERC